MRALGVPVASVPKAWPLVVDWVAEALTKGKADETPDDILSRLLRGKQQLWLMWDEGAARARGIVVTELYDSARGGTCNLAIIAGANFKSWRHITEDIKAFAR